MKYSEFKQRVIDIGFTVEDEAREVWVVDDEGDIVATVSTDITNSMDTDYIAFKEQGEDVRREILDLSYKLSKTPLAEREEEKLYRVKFPSTTRWGNAVYLQKDTSDKDPIGVDWSPEDFILDEKQTKYIFTEQEIKAIDERYLAFKVEVKDE